MATKGKQLRFDLERERERSCFSCGRRGGRMLESSYVGTMHHIGRRCPGGGTHPSSKCSPEVVCDFGALNILTFLDQWNASFPLYHSVKQQIMAPCCQCKGTGRCLSCFCVKRGLNCTSCHPNRTSRCANQSAQKRPLGLGKGSSQPQLPRNKVNIETTLSQPALPLAVSSAGLPYQTSRSTEESSCSCPPLSVVSATSGKTPKYRTVPGNFFGQQQGFFATCTGPKHGRRWQFWIGFFGFFGDCH